MSGTYASNTSVSSDKSRSEIERTLIRYGATSFAYGWQEGSAVIGFVANRRQVRFILPMPDPSGQDITMTPTHQRRSATAQTAAYDQAVRQRWRALALVVKAKLEAVNTGIVSFEEEFLAHMILPGGASVFETVAPAIERAYTTGQVGNLLQIGGAS